MRSPVLLALAILAPLALSPASAAIIADSSFEAVRIPAGGYQYDPTGSPWTFTSSAGLTSNGGPFYTGTAPDGSQAAFVQSAVANGGISYMGKVSQTLTGLTAGATYTLTFFMAARGAGAGNSVDVQFAGIDLGTYTPTGTAFVQQATASFVAPSATGLLSFTGGYSVADVTTDIDALALTQVANASAAPVPEPASILLLAAGLGLVTLRRRA